MNKRRIASIMLVMTILFSLAASANAESSTFQPLDISDFEDEAFSVLNDGTVIKGEELQKLVNESYVDQRDAVSAYQNMVSLLGIDDETGYISWDDDYAGSYINEDAVLEVYVTELTSETEKKYFEYCKTDKIILKEVQYSYKELQNLSANIENYGFDDAFYGIDDKNNSIDVYVSLDKYSDKYSRSDIVKSVSGLPINVIFDEMSFQNSSTIMGGGRAYNDNTSGGTFSISAWGTLSNGTVGFVTCGHVFMGSSGSYNSSYANVYASSAKATVVGTASSSRTYDTGDYDCAFITKTSSIYTPTSSFTPGGTLAGVSSMTQGGYVYKYGASGGMGYAYATYTQSGYSDHTKFYTLDYSYSSSCFGSAADGDSGGAIYTINSSSQKILIGIVMARKGTDIGYASRADSAFTKLGVTIY